jgi:uncharacterized membrane protein
MLRTDQYEGFVHTISRGQYEVLRPTNDVGRFIGQIGIFAETTIVNFGVIYLALALVPFCFLHRMRPPERRWMFGLSCLFLCVSLLWLAMLNPSDDRAIIDLDKEFFTPAHLVLAVWSGYGLILLGKILSAPKPEASS